MSYNRRKFITSVGTVTAGGFLLQSSVQKLLASAPELKPGRLRVAVFYDRSFPEIGEITLNRRDLEEGLKEFDVQFLSGLDLATALKREAFDLFINPFGSAFPLNGLNAIHAYLLAGGNWLNLGGTPLTVPVSPQFPFPLKGPRWQIGKSQTSYRRQIGITESFPVAVSGIKEYQVNPDLEDSGIGQHDFSASRIDELYCRFTSTKDFPAEDGSAGPRDAVLHPLYYGVDAEKTKIAAPFVIIERRLGEYAGGMWVFATITGKLSPHAIGRLAHIAARRQVEFSVLPSFAAYKFGEVPSISVRLKKFDPVGGKNRTGDFTHLNVSLVDKDDHQISEADIPHASINRPGEVHTIAVNFPALPNPLPCGFYRLSAVLTISVEQKGAKEATREVRALNGFWVYDDNLLSGADSITTDNNYFYRNNTPYPVTGTTYMASDVHRKFLFEPNPFLWMRDFGSMKDTGINMVRTGIWTGWKNMMFDAGVPLEQILRAIDAFVLTALSHDIPVIFTLFAFLPESWGGENPYLDPRSVDAQKKFVIAVTSRYRRVRSVIWDLINEPSFCNPAHLWETRPNYDRWERDAWKQYIRQGNEKFAKAGLPRFDERFRESPGGAEELPALTDFEDAGIFTDRHPIKAMEYRRFAQEKFSEWVRTMRSAITGDAGDGPAAGQLVTVGQDEGGTGESPNNQNFGNDLSFTSIHNWWLNDDLLWDGVVTKKSGRANLVEETGVMFNESLDRAPWRSEEEVSALLERKLAAAFAAGGAGFVEWLWNSNPYMNSDNEAAIGLHRVDGSAKPELEPVRRYAAFFRENARLLGDKDEAEITMLIPYANQFSPRSGAAEATKRCVRTMMSRLHLPMNSADERQGDTSAKLLLYPSPGVIPAEAWERALASVESGNILYISGPIESDDFLMHSPRLNNFHLSARVTAVAQEEVFELEQQRYYLDFRGDKMQKVEKAIVDGDSASTIHQISYGKGTICWSPLPVELSDSPGILEAIYSWIVRKAGVGKYISVENDTPLVAVVPSVYKKYILCACISETDRDADLTLRHVETSKTIDIKVKSGRTALVWIDRSSGAVISKLD